MLTAYAKDPRPSHNRNVVDNSTHVKRESHYWAKNKHSHRNESRSAMGCATGACGALRFASDAPFAVTLADGAVAMMHAPPAAVPLIIPSHFPWPAADMARPVHPAIEVMQ